MYDDRKTDKNNDNNLAFSNSSYRASNGDPISKYGSLCAAVSRWYDLEQR